MIDKEIAFPQEIKNFFPGQEINWLRYLDKKISKHEPTGSFSGADVYDIGDKQNRYIVLVKHNAIVYFVHVSQVKDGALRFGRQVLLWRNTKSIYSASFPSHVFFDILLPEYGAVITDTLQTEKGKLFWQTLVALVLQKKHPGYIYFYNKDKRPLEFVEVTSVDQLNDLAPDIWGEKTPFQRRLLIISQSKLSAPKAK